MNRIFVLSLVAVAATGFNAAPAMAQHHGHHRSHVNVNVGVGSPYGYVYANPYRWNRTATTLRIKATTAWATIPAITGAAITMMIMAGDIIGATIGATIAAITATSDQNEGSR